MKKILAMLGSILLGGTSVSSVIACQPDTTTPDEEVAKTNWSDEEILTRFGELEVTAENNGDLRLVSKNSDFKIWSGTDDGNKYERTVSKENIDNLEINYFFDSLLPTTASYDNPYGVELMSAFFVGKTREAVLQARHNSVGNSFINKYISEMPHGNQLKFRDKNAYSIYMGSLYNDAESFSATGSWYKIIPVTASDGSEYFIGLSSIYVDFFIGYLTDNMTLWVEEFFTKYSKQISGWSEDIVIDEKVNEKDSILKSDLKHNKNIIIKNTKMDLTENITLEDGEESSICDGLNYFIFSKLYNHRLKYAEMPDSRFYNYFCGPNYEIKAEPTESHFETGFRVYLPNRSAHPSPYGRLYMNIDVIYDK